MTEDLKRRFAVNGEPLIDETTLVGSYHSRGNSPHWSAYKRHTGFALPPGAAPMSSSGAVCARGGGRGGGAAVGGGWCEWATASCTWIPC